MAMKTCGRCGAEWTTYLFDKCPRCKHGLEWRNGKKRKRRTSGEVELEKRLKKTSTRRKR